jgi:hypothetical protein
MSDHIVKPGLLRASGLLLIMALAACATSGKQESLIGDRAQARWDLLLAEDYAGAYRYLSPAYRSSVSSTQYQRRLLLRQVRWTDARYIDSDCLENSCKVRISLDYSLRKALPGVPRYDGTQEVDEQWVKSEGEWWYVPEN